MSTISLYKDKLNSAGGLISSMISSLSGLDGQLDSLKTTLQGVDSSTCNMQSTVDCISSSSKTEKEKIGDLQRLNNKLDEFIGVATGRDGSAKSEINRAKDDFYTTYGYLKPDCEKSKWQRRWEKICDTVDSACDWCKEHWKIIVTAVVVVVAVALLFSGIGSGIGAVILAGACWGAIFGAVIGGVSGGIMSAVKGGSFWDGFENGAFDGVISGAIGGAITGGLGFAIGPAATFWGSVARGAGIGAVSSGVSNMAVTTVDYLIDHGTLKGSADDILISGFTGALSGALAGGATGGMLHLKSQMKVSDPSFLKSDGSIDWDQAPNNGRVPGTVADNQTLKQGTMIDRYGHKWGNYTAPAGTPYGERALPYKENLWAYHKYIVTKDISGVTSSEVASAFGQTGGGIQYELPGNIADLIKNGFLKEVFF